MKKLFLTATLITALGLSLKVNAQYYNGGYNYAAPQGYNYVAPRGYNYAAPQGYTNGGSSYYTTPRPSYVPPQYRASTYKYNEPQKTLEKSIYDGRITVGADYMVSFASYDNTDFAVESPLPGGQDYVSGTRDFDRQIRSLQFNMGWRIFKSLGLEAFYTHSLDDKRISYTDSYTGYPRFAQGQYTLYYKAYGLDLLWYHPVNDFIEFIASIGVGKYDAEAKVKVSVYEDDTHTTIFSNSKTFSESVMGYRVGGGFQFWVSKHIAFRLMGRWTQLGGDFMRYITEINAGVRYHFN